MIHERLGGRDRHLQIRNQREMHLAANHQRRTKYVDNSQNAANLLAFTIIDHIDQIFGFTALRDADKHIIGADRVAE